MRDDGGERGKRRDIQMERQMVREREREMSKGGRDKR